MKMLKLGILVSAAFVLTSLIGCKSNLDEEYSSISNGKSQVAMNIQEMKKAGLFDEILNASRSAEENDEEHEMMVRFINDTDSVLAEITASENGEQELKVIEALFNGSTTEEFAEAFSAINPEKSAEYLNYVNENLVLEGDCETTVSRAAASVPKTLCLRYNIPRDRIARGAYADNLDWNTIGWYTGFCAATVAGFYLASYGGFWSKIAGGVAAFAGAGSMAAQLLIWTKCSDIGNFVSSLSNKDAVTANSIIQSEDGSKILTIGVETTVTVGACCISPFGKLLIATAINYYNVIVGKILSVLPSGVHILINGVPLHLL